MDLSWQAWVTLAVVGAVLLALLREWARPEVVMMAGLVALMVTGVLSPEQAFSGFSSPALFTIAALLVVAAGVQRTDALRVVDRWLRFSGEEVQEGQLLRRILPVTAVLSAFINNTPLVAFWIPKLQELAERHRLSTSRLLLPVSYAAIVGGTVTLAGTSTNLVASGILQQHGLAPFGFFELTYVGLPVAVVVVAFLVLVGYRLLPARLPPQDRPAPESFQFELRVSPGGGLAGKTIRDAGLRALGQAYLAHITRAGRVLGPVSPDDLLEEGDVLTFVGDPAVMDRLLSTPGLERVVSQREQPQGTLPLYEAVVSDSSMLVGRSLKEVRFRETFGGVALAIRRRGERIAGGLGNVPIRVGDVLLVEAPPAFEQRWNHQTGEFFLVARRDRPFASTPQRAPVALLWLGGALCAHLALKIPLVVAAMLAAGGMVVSNCLDYHQLRHAVRPSMLVTIAAAMGIGRAIELSGLAGALGRTLLGVGDSWGPVGLVATLYASIALVTELVTNAAAVAFMLPVALSAAEALALDPRPVAVLVTVGASASFISPFGYQTNLMVMGIGGYAFRDYLRIGLPTSLLAGLTAVTLALWRIG